MARFAGKIGYVFYSETEPGVFEDVTIERTCYGDVITNTRRYEDLQINQNLTINNQISIIADDYAYSNLPYCKYIEWNNVKWAVTSISIQRPRLILSLGGIYNGN